MKRIPIIPTIIVALAAAFMAALGIWQYRKIGMKEAFVALAKSNPAKPAVSFPQHPPVDGAILFRPSSVVCLRMTGQSVEAGRAADGSMGFRVIAQCVTGAEGPGALVNLGVSDRPDAHPAWRGGRVEGWIAEEPDHRSVIGRLVEKSMPLRPMLIARNAGIPGLKPSAPPHAEDIPNNHLSYAVQWFAFAAIAIIIYALALSRRMKKPETVAVDRTDG